MIYIYVVVSEFNEGWTDEEFQASFSDRGQMEENAKRNLMMKELKRQRIFMVNILRKTVTELIMKLDNGKIIFEEEKKNECK